jgi:abortive infection bacteriophage resistance protein
MQFGDTARAQRKLAQVGYYRLSGFWFPCRDFLRDERGEVLLCGTTRKPLRGNTFSAGTRFETVFDLYLFDKKLRQLMLDAIERIEVHVRSVIAHEVGYHDPLAYQNVDFINPSQVQGHKDRQGRARNIWAEWLKRQDEQVRRSREDCIEWHRRSNKAIPVWAVVEAWDFGTLSKYFEILKRSHQNRISKRLGVQNPMVLKSWLQEINTLRNRCAHHVRIWNQVSTNPLPVPEQVHYFQSCHLGPNGLSRSYGLIVVLWYLLANIGANSRWIHLVADLIDTKPNVPGCSYHSMGFTDESGFPRQLFNISSSASRV